MLLIFFFSLIIVISNSSIPLIHPDFDLTNPVSTTLDNGNIFIINKNGVYICDKSLSSIIKTSLSFSADNQLTKDDLSKVIISKLDDKAVICLIKSAVYIFNGQGDYLQTGNLKLHLIDGTPEAFTLFGVKEVSNTYIYYVGFAVNNRLYLQSFEYQIEDNRIEIMKANYDGIKCCLQMNSYCQEKDIKNGKLSCQMMVYNYDEEKIMCFYIIVDNDLEYFGIGHFVVDGGSFKRSNDIYKSHEIDQVASIKSVLSPDSKIAFILIMILIMVMIQDLILIILIAMINYVKQIFIL